MTKRMAFLVSTVLVASVLFMAPVMNNSVPAASASPSLSWATPQQKACLNGLPTFGHRGFGKNTVRSAGRRYTENTLQSFARAMAVGMCGIETDLRATRGGCVVLNHDATWRRTTNGRGSVARKSCGYAARRKTPSGAKVASAYQAIDLMARSSTGFALSELKRGAISASQVRSIISYANRKLRNPQLLRFTSGDPRMLALVKSIDKRYPTGLIRFGAYDRPSVTAVPWYVDMVMLDWRAVNAPYVNALHARGKSVSARNVDSVAVYNHVKRLGVDAVVTGRPATIGSRR